MVTWVKTGTVDVTNNSTTVVGHGTMFVEEFREGDGFVGPDDKLYEILNLVSESQLTLGKPYGGATATGQGYSVIPIQGYLQRTADRLSELTREAGDTITSPNISALAEAVAAANGVLYFQTQTQIATLPSKAFGQGLLNLADTAALKAAAGLSNADNTSDLNKPISTATQTALNLKADKTQLGTAAAGTVTTSTRDLNVGRVMRIGDGGMTGTSISLPITDLNTILEPGRFAFGNGVTNGPATGVAYYMDVQVHGALVLQRLRGMLATHVHLEYVRCFANSAWSPWQQTIVSGVNGIGGQSIQLNTLDQLNALSPLQQGFYFATGAVITAAGIPKGYGGVILHYGRGGDTAVQHYTSTGTNDVQVYTRTYNTVSIGWSPWVKNLTSLDTPTSTQNGVTGQLLRIGDYGYGGYLPQISESNINAQRMGGNYFVISNSSGVLPVATNGYLTIESYDGSFSKQTFTHLLDGRVWIRVCNNGTWTSWKHMTPIGTGQSWVTVTRNVGTTYTNDTGRTIMLNAAGQSSAITGSGQYLRVNIAGVIVAHGSSVASPNMVIGVQCAIPPGASYVVESMGGTLIAPYASELR